MKTTNHRFDRYSLEHSGYRINHVKNSMVGAPGEDYEFAVFLYDHDNLVSEIIRYQLTIPPHEKSFVSGRRGIGTGCAGKNEDVREYLSGYADSPKSFEIVFYERFFETDIFPYKGKKSKITIPAGSFAEIYLGVSICVKKAPEAPAVIEMAVRKYRCVNGSHFNRQVFCVLCECA